MGTREFFDTKRCERCHSELTVRTVSWFTEETICGACSLWEEAIIQSRDESKSDLEGIGSIPDVEFDVNWGKEVPDELMDL